MIHRLIDGMTILDMVGVGDRVCFAHVSYHRQKGFVRQLIGGVELFGRQIVWPAILHKFLDQSLVETVVVSSHVHNKTMVTDDTQLLQQSKQDTKGDGCLKIVCFHFDYTHRKKKSLFFIFIYWLRKLDHWKVAPIRFRPHECCKRK